MVAFIEKLKKVYFLILLNFNKRISLNFLIIFIIIIYNNNKI